MRPPNAFFRGRIEALARAAPNGFVSAKAGFLNPAANLFEIESQRQDPVQILATTEARSGRRTVRGPAASVRKFTLAYCTQGQPRDLDADNNMPAGD